MHPNARLLLTTGVASLLVFGACSDGGEPQEDSRPGADGLPLADTRISDGRHDASIGDGALRGPCAPSAELLAQVDPARMLQDLTALTSMAERHTAQGQKKAADYLKAQLSALTGAKLREHSYTYKGQSYVNLELTVPGSQSGGQTLLAGAHFDSISSDPANAPGADDNASGTVALLETARVLSGCRPQQSLRLVFLSNEEVGTIGSIAYVSDIKASLPPAKVTGFIAVDMVGYGADTEDLDLATVPAQKSFADAVGAAMKLWAKLPVKEIISEHCG